MRTLFVCLTLLITAGCQSYPVSVNPERQSVKLYTSRDQIQTATVQELGTVSGSACQLTRQDRPVNINDARSDMLRRAAHMEGNAVLLTRCEVVGAVAGCHNSAVCEGILLNAPQ